MPEFVCTLQSPIKSCMSKLTLSVLISFALTNVFISCKTYSIPVSDFKNLFEGKERTKNYSFTGPMNIHVSYMIYPIDSIRGIDKKGNIRFLKNSRSMEIRVADLNNKNHNIYFHSIRIIDSTLVGTETTQANDWQLSWDTSPPDPLSIKTENRKTRYHRVPLDSIKKVVVTKW